jgi:hypothetical protein
VLRVRRPLSLSATSPESPLVSSALQAANAQSEIPAKSQHLILAMSAPRPLAR